MILQIITENGVKKLKPLTADAGAGLPVGTVIAMYKKTSPSGFLYLDGRDTTGTADELSTHYPLLYAYLGSNVLPDYREFGLVGAEENTTDVYNASTNPTGTIHDHDIYTEGQAKDDQLQDHKHNDPYTNNPVTSGYTRTGKITTTTQSGTEEGGGIVNTYRKGTVTRGKRKAVFFYIKATSGISEEAQDTVASQLNAERSYSTEEINTGKTWIDGKPIYRKTLDCEALPNSGNKIIAHNIANLGTVTKIYGLANYNNTVFITLPMASTTPIDVYINGSNLIIYTTDNRSGYNGYVILEYTKTT